MSHNQPIAIVAGARTPFAKAFTNLKDVSAVQLGQQAITDALRRASLSGEDIDEVVMGNVAGPPDAANVARVIALKAGIPQERIAHTVNRNCASGMESILGAWQAIESGRAKLAIAGGTESMTNIPLMYRPEAARLWLQLAKSKTMGAKLKTLASFRPKHFKPLIGIELGLTDPVSGLNMGETAEVLAEEFGITRQEQDAFAVESHQKACEAQEKCFLSGEITAIQTPSGKTIDKDNGPRSEQSMQQLAKLRPFFKKDGTVTAGNSCPLTDGAAALVMTSPSDLGRFEAEPLGFITSYAVAGCDPRRMGLGPVYATAKLLKQTGLKLSDFDLVEINEAFAAQVIACQRAALSKSFAEKELGMSEPLGEFASDKLNIHGGAIALGHPVGTTGTRLILTLLRALRATGGSRGLATLCVGGGQGVAMVVETNLGDK
ncbi:MAG: thiolase family protein [Pirellulaceae bacterium]|nr:thiolase family protein [Pirellulaceae bacterium]